PRAAARLSGSSSRRTPQVSRMIARAAALGPANGVMSSVSAASIDVANSMIGSNTDKPFCHGRARRALGWDDRGRTRETTLRVAVGARGRAAALPGHAEGWSRVWERPGLGRPGGVVQARAGLAVGALGRGRPAASGSR